MVRVRFAPSPTGHPHIGNIRTALFNWLFARHHGGVFVLRIEDTDRERVVEGATEEIMESLRWLGIDWDEGPDIGGPYSPYIQSQRLEKYQAVANKLLNSGQAYLCFCSKERLERLHQERQAKKQPPGYDRHCRNLSKGEVDERLKQGLIPVVRLKTPLEGQTKFKDLIRGEVVFQNRTLDDFILLKSNGYPTYHLASITDDWLMGITHVLRAEEWLPSTPKHILLYQALGISPPQFAHLPMILGPDRSKLSKRHGAISVAELRGEGYLPEAVINYLALLGWSLDEKTELFSQEELVRYFSLERVGKAAAIFNQDKMRWMNGVYIRKLSTEEFIERALPFLEAGLPKEIPRPLPLDYLKRLSPFVQERARTLSEVVYLSELFWIEPEYDPYLLWEGIGRERASLALRATIQELSGTEDFEAGRLEGLLRQKERELSLSTAQYFGLLRVAITGRTASPPLMETMAILGKERCLKRLEKALKIASG